VRGEVEWSEVRRAAAKAGERPVVEAAPDVAARLERRHPGDARWRSALEMLVEERDQHALAEPAGGVDAPVQGAKRHRRVIGLAVMPGAECEMRLRARLHRVEQGGGAIDVLLVPQAGY